MTKFFFDSRGPALLGLLILAAGCNNKTPDPNNAGAAPAVAHTGAPLTKEDGQAFGASLEQAFANGDIAKANQLLRITDLLKRCISDVGLSPQEQRGFIAGASPAGENFSSTITKEVSEGGSYQVVNVRMVAGRPRVLMRLLDKNTALNYHEFSLVRYPDQEIAAEDIYIYVTGEPLSQTMRRLILGLFVGMKGNAKLNSKEQLLVKHMGDAQQLSTMVRSGQFSEALALFRTLPAELQNDKYFQIVAIQAASGTGNEEDYLSEMERFRQNYPTEAAGDLIAIDYHLLKKDYEAALETIDRLDKSLGGDPYLDTTRANVLAMAEKFPEALVLADKAIKNAPKMPQGYWTRATVAALSKDYDETLVSLKQLVESLELTIDADALVNDERFVNFAGTPQFAEFKKWLATRSQ